MFQKILVPIEFGPLAEPAIRLARKLAKGGAEMRFVHVVPNDDGLMVAEMLRVDQIVASCTKRMKELVDAHADGLRVDFALREGPVAAEIVAEIEQWGPDVVVLGSHGRKWLGRLLLGSVAESVLRFARVPVCVVKGESTDASALRHVCFATDLEDTSDRAARCFEDLLAGTQARGTVVHAFQPEHWVMATALPVAYFKPTVARTKSGELDPEGASHVIEKRDARNKALVAYGATLTQRGLDVTTRFVEGAPWTAVEALTEESAVDLLILGGHKYGTVDRFVLGSVSEKTLRSVGCSVLVVPREG